MTIRRAVFGVSRSTLDNAALALAFEMHWTLTKHNEEEEAGRYFTFADPETGDRFGLYHNHPPDWYDDADYADIYNVEEYIDFDLLLMYLTDKPLDDGAKGKLVRNGWVSVVLLYEDVPPSESKTGTGYRITHLPTRTQLRKQGKLERRTEPLEADLERLVLTLIDAVRNFCLHSGDIIRLVECIVPHPYVTSVIRGAPASRTNEQILEELMSWERMPFHLIFRQVPLDSTHEE